MIKYVIYSVHILFCLFHDFGPQLQATLLPLPQADQSTGQVHPSAAILLYCSRCSGYEPKEGGQLSWPPPKTRFRMVFLVGTATYIGPAPHLDVILWLIFYSSQSPSSIHYR